MTDRKRAGARDRAAKPPASAARRLGRARILWIASVRTDRRPHLAPVWFAWVGGSFYVSTAPGSVKARNLERNRRAVVALEDGVRPLVCEVEASTVARPYPRPVVEAFLRKYDWRIDREATYSRLLRLSPRRWQAG